MTRGAFSYLDDKGVQRTIQYIAGAGIGYRVVQDTTGPGTHLLPRPAGTEFGILYPRGGAGGAGGGGVGGGAGGNGATPGSDDFGNNGIPGDDDGPGGIGSNGIPVAGGSTPGTGGSGSAAAGGGGGVNIDGSPGIDDNAIDADGPFGDRDDFDDNNRKSNRPGTDSDFPPKRDRGFGTIITNSGDTFFGIAPGASARAHVQNIDLKPWGEDGAISPAEALRRDERRSLRLRFRG